MRSVHLIALTAAVLAALVAVHAGYAFIGDARSYNEGNSTDVQYITVALGDTQYSSAVTSEITYHTEIIINQSGRTITYIPEHTGTITADAVTYPVTEVVQFDLSIASDSPGPLPSYSLSVTVDDASKMYGTSIASYWTDPSNDGTRTDVLFPAAGIVVNSLTSASIKLCLFVSTEDTTEAPDKPLDDIAFKFRTTTGA